MNIKQLKLIGALTSKPYAFTARSWELKNIETLDLFDSLCSNIKIDIRGSDIMRILPINNEFINEEWISDKARFAYDGLKRWRFINPLVKNNNTGFTQVSWQEIFSIINDKITKIKFNNIIINTGHFTDIETIGALKFFSKKQPNIIINNQLSYNSDLQNYFFKSEELTNVSGQKIYILIGINLRLENPVLNIRLRKLSILDSVLIAFIGPQHDYNINCLHLGTNLQNLVKIIEGKHFFSTTIVTFLKKTVKNYKIKNLFKNYISVILPNISFQENNAFLMLSKNKNNLIKTLNFEYRILSNYTGKLNALELGFFNNNKIIINNNYPNLLYLIGIEDYKNIKDNDLVIFQGHHNDAIRTRFDIILPTVNWTEKSSIYFNILGNVQKTNTVKLPPLNSRLDWKIVRMISILFKEDITFDKINKIHFYINTITPNVLNSLTKYKINSKYKIKFEYNKSQKEYILLYFMPFKNRIYNYYISNSLNRSSKNMIECTLSLEKTKNNFLK